jgi:hypothetical protein
VTNDETRTKGDATRRVFVDSGPSSARSL